MFALRLSAREKTLSKIVEGSAIEWGLTTWRWISQQI